jgi:hypothetical protein
LGSAAAAGGASEMDGGGAATGAAAGAGAGAGTGSASGPVCVTGAGGFSLGSSSISIAPFTRDLFRAGSGALVSDGSAIGSLDDAGSGSGGLGFDASTAGFVSPGFSGAEVVAVGWGSSVPVMTIGSMTGSLGFSGAGGAGSSGMLSSGRGVPPAGVEPFSGVWGTDMTSTGLGGFNECPSPPFSFFASTSEGCLSGSSFSIM